MMFGIAAVLFASPAMAEEPSTPTPAPGVSEPAVSAGQAKAAKERAPSVIPANGVGIGLGVLLDTSGPATSDQGFPDTISLVPFNTASLRFRIEDILELEPSAGIGFGRTSERRGDDDPVARSTTSWRASVLARGVALRRGPVELHGIGVGAVGGDRSVVGEEPARTSSLVSLGWGLGVSWWPSERFSLTGDALSPILTSTRSARGEDENRRVESSLAVSAALAPQIRVMGHLWF